MRHAADLHDALQQLTAADFPGQELLPGGSAAVHIHIRFQPNRLRRRHRRRMLRNLCLRYRVDIRRIGSNSLVIIVDPFQRLLKLRARQALCMVLCLVPTTAFAESETEETLVCTCETACTAEAINAECPVCGTEGALAENCGKYAAEESGQTGTSKDAPAITAADVQALIDALPEAETISEDNAADVEVQLEAIDEVKVQLSDEDFADGSIDILTLLHKSGLVASKSEGRRAVQQGGVAVDGEKVSDISATFAKADFEGEGKVVRKGKKNFRKVIAK